MIRRDPKLPGAVCLVPPPLPPPGLDVVYRTWKHIFFSSPQPRPLLEYLASKDQ